MTNNNDIYFTILGMALVTYLTRICGFYISNRIQHMPRSVEQGLKYIPGTIIVSIIAPQIISGGSVTLIAAGICLGASLIFKNLVAVMVTGVMTISILRNVIFI
ncbi:MAG: AzlD domain-containing protein [Proteobacteria bacterium]|nr:AzlD domain-containing protein [Pseudomonadota bacterium]MBU1585928.1 AzlD domain-containing protein [Pseudomonadota bacterium]MBU2455250.1 AzlD domain-containing protein [Pseudomonadota bacterium]MBU2628572.1 AzlD domain-containing protein [Pseudomonadota bacterium]